MLNGVRGYLFNALIIVINTKQMTSSETKNNNYKKLITASKPPLFLKILLMYQVWILKQKYENYEFPGKKKN